MSEGKTQIIGASLLRLCDAHMTPKALFEAVRKEHPKASKNEIIRAAFRALIDGASHDPCRGQKLHQLAISSRGSLSGE